MMCTVIAVAAFVLQAGAPQWESQLAFPDQRDEYAAVVASIGATEVTLTVFGGDDTSINILQADESTRASWRSYVAQLNSRGIVPIVYLSEWEHNASVGVTTRLEIASATVATFQGLDIIACLGEELDVPTSTARPVAEFLRPSGWHIATHNPHSGAPYARWQQTTDQLIREGLLDVVLAQCESTEIDAFVARWQRDGVAVIAHEELGGTAPGDRMVWWFASAAMAGAHGVSIYPGYELPCSDLFCPAAGALTYETGFREATRTDWVLLGDPSIWPVDRRSDGVVDAADMIAERR